MARTKLDALATVFSRLSGRPKDELLIELNSTVIPNFKDPSDLLKEISKEDYDELLSIGEREGAGILNWMIDGLNDGSFEYPEN